MGLELSLAALWMRRDQTPNWPAAEHEIRNLRLETVWDTGDEYFPWEAWLEDAPNPPAPLGVYKGLRAAQAKLSWALAEVRHAVRCGARDMLAIALPDHTVYVAGSLTVGDPPAVPW